ncbi:MAG: CehA/McbA family metallohydrolase [Acidobacteria bacterium]|nr:CehA/McbA family metallohydrolase [Acidobacteriota bacterium]
MRRILSKRSALPVVVGLAVIWLAVLDWSSVGSSQTVPGRTQSTRVPDLGPVGADFSTGRLWVRLRDEAGRPAAARIYLKDDRDRAYIAPGSIARQSGRSSEYYFHADGQFQIEMPEGEVTIEAVKGSEYIPQVAKVRLRPSHTNSVLLTLRRLMDLPSMGWYSGDVHMHPNHVPGGLYVTMDDCRVLAAGEDIKVGNLLISSVGSFAHVFDTEFFNQGQPDSVSTDETILVVQEEFRNTSAMYGHMPLLGIKRLVEPFYTGQENSAYWEDYPPNYTIAKAARDQGGAVSYTHPSDGPEIPVGFHLAREFPIDLALDVVDALDILSNKDEEGACWMYYRVLNCGLKCTASAGTDSQMDVARHALPGGSKVYVKVAAPLTYDKWIEGYKAGRTFVSNGPLLLLEVDGKEPGAEIRLSTPGTVRVRAKTASNVPIDVLELIVNGEVAAQVKNSGDGTSLEIDRVLRLDKSSWVAARVWGPPHRLVVNDPQAFAHTSPVYVYIGDQKIASAKDAKIVLAWIDRLIHDVAESPRFATEARRNEV